MLLGALQRAPRSCQRLLFSSQAPVDLAQQRGRLEIVRTDAFRLFEQLRRLLQFAALEAHSRIKITGLEQVRIQAQRRLEFGDSLRVVPVGEIVKAPRDMRFGESGQ